MSLLAEHVPKDDRPGFAGEILDLKLFRAFDHLRIVCAGLAQAGEIAFNVGHEHGYTSRAEIFGERLECHGLSGASCAGNQAVAVCHFRQEKDWFVRLSDKNWLGHSNWNYFEPESGDLSSPPAEIVCLSTNMVATVGTRF